MLPSIPFAELPGAWRTIFHVARLHHALALFACLIPKKTRQNQQLGCQALITAVSIRDARFNAIEFSPLRQNLSSYLWVYSITPASPEQIPCQGKFTPCYETRYSLTFLQRQFGKNSYLTTFHYKIEVAAVDAVWLLTLCKLSLRIWCYSDGTFIGSSLEHLNRWTIANISFISNDKHFPFRSE